jgi:hypothetical protein
MAAAKDSGMVGRGVRRSKTHLAAFTHHRLLLAGSGGIG